jgi:hypothetical protein
MIECRSRLRFALESLERNGIVRSFRGEEFQRNGPAEPSVFGLVDDTHPATAQLFEDAVVRNGFTDERFVAGHCGAS